MGRVAKWFWRGALVLGGLFLCGLSGVWGQRVAVVDTRAIMEAMPEYQKARRYLDSLARAWHQEIENRQREIAQLRQQYQEEKFLLTEEMRREREQLIQDKEQEMRQLQRSYFGPNGKLFQEQERLLKPIQEKIYQAVREVAMNKRYSLVLDQSAGAMILYVERRYDITDEVKKRLGLKD